MKTILATGAERAPLDAPQTPAAYAEARFARSAATLFGTSDAEGGDAPVVH